MAVGKDTTGLVGKAAQGATLLLLMSVAQRLVTFSMNTVLLAFTEAEVLGFAAHDMELLLSSILFLAREGVRLTALRGDTQSGGAASQSLVNLAWLVTPAATLLATAAAFAFSSTARNPEELHTVLVFAGAAVVECLAEPAFVVAAGALRFDVRVRAEGAAVFAKTLVTLGAVLGLQWTSLAFAVGQLAYAVTLVGVYAQWAYASGTLHRLAPRWLPGGQQAVLGVVMWEHASLGGSFTGQGVLKHILTEGDRLVLASTASRADKGVYSVVTNLGSLAPRLIFQPVEDAARTLFGKLAGVLSSPSSSEEERATAARQASSALSVVLRCVLLIGVTFAAFAPPFTGVLVRLLLPGHWALTPAPPALAAYCVYVATLALNGVTEAFVFAAASKAQLLSLNARLVAISLLYGGAAWVALGPLGAGAVGLIAAGCANMGLRAASSIAFITAFFHRHPTAPSPWTGALPTPWTLVAAAGGGAVGHVAGIALSTHPWSPGLSTVPRSTLIAHVGVGALAAAPFLLRLYTAEWQHVKRALTLVRSQRGKAE